MNSPKKHHVIMVPEVLNPGTLKKLTADWEEAEKEASRVVLFRAAGDVFCTGMDLEWVAQKDLDFSHLESYSSLLGRIMQSSMVSIAVVEGDVIGGGVGIVSASDFVFASNESSFQLTEALIGLIPGIILLPLLNRVNRQKIKRMLFTAEKYVVAKAIEIGLVDEVYQGMDQVEALIEKLRQCKRQSIQDFKAISQEVHLGNTGLHTKGIALLKNRINDPIVKERISNIFYYNSLSL